MYAQIKFSTLQGRFLHMCEGGPLISKARNFMGIPANSVFFFAVVVSSIRDERTVP